MFEPNLKKLGGEVQRQGVIEAWKGLTRAYTDPAYPAVHLLPGWHGTSPQKLDSIFRAGYSNLSFTDDGYFGKGLYSAYEADYAFRVFGNKGGALILNWMASFSILPVIDGDMNMLRNKGNYMNYDSHFVPVVPRNPNNPDEKVYYPCRPDQKARYHEIVLFQTAACLPRYLVHLEKLLIPPLKEVVVIQPGLISDYTVDTLGIVSVSVQGSHSTMSETPSTTVLQEPGLISDYTMPCYPRTAELLESLVEQAPKVKSTEEKTTQLSSRVLLAWLQENYLYPYDEAAKQKASAYYKEAYQEREVLKSLAEMQGNLEARYQLGLLYSYYPDATAEERRAAAEHYRLAATQGHIGAQLELGLLYETGKGVDANGKTAVYCYQSAAKGGNARAMYHLASCFVRGIGEVKDQNQAVYWYQQAANQGDALAQNNLASCYEQGHGVQLDYTQAICYYCMAAEQGFGLAQYNLGVIYQQGRSGVPKNLVKAAQYYHLAVAQNLVRAHSNLACFYEQGLGGMLQDYNKAFHLYLSAANQGYARAQYNVGLCYELGRGTQRDIERARHYYTAAVNAKDVKDDVKVEAKRHLAQLTQSTPTVSTTPFQSTPLFQLPQNQPF